MNIDERLQALVQTVELLASLYRDEEARRRDDDAKRHEDEAHRIAKHEALALSVELLVSMHKDNETRVAQLMDTMNRMGRIIEKHDLDIDDHEDRVNDIEGRPGA